MRRRSSPRLRAIFAARYDRAAGSYELRAADILADRINGFDDWLADPHIVATGGAVAVEPAGMRQFQVPRTPGISAAADAALTPAPRYRRARAGDPRRARPRRRRASPGSPPKARCACRHERGFRSAPAPLPESKFFEDLAVRRQLLHPEPHRHRRQFRRVPDRLGRQSPDPLRHRILPRARPSRRRSRMAFRCCALPPPAPAPSRM